MGKTSPASLVTGVRDMSSSFRQSDNSLSLFVSSTRCERMGGLSPPGSSRFLARRRQLGAGEARALDAHALANGLVHVQPQVASTMHVACTPGGFFEAIRMALAERSSDQP